MDVSTQTTRLYKRNCVNSVGTVQLCAMNWEEAILYKDMHFAVVNKPYLMLSQQDKNEEKGLSELLYEHLGKPNSWQLLQRLDRVAGGLMSIALSKRAGALMQEMQLKQEIEKTYLIITERAPDEEKGRLEQWIKRQGQSQRFRVSNEKVKGSKAAVLTYEVLEKKGERCLMMVKPITGRTHQIRVQMASIACPVVGDKKYGKTKWLADRSICLFSKSVSFQHPLTKKPIVVEAPAPTTREVWSGFDWK